MKLKPPIGASDFKKIREDKYYYVDKSLLINDILEDGAETLLLPRPRRFGKTLNLSMLRYFFEKSKDNNHRLFKDLKVAELPDIMAHQGLYPVVYLSFKDLKSQNWDECLDKFKYLLSEEFIRIEKNWELHFFEPEKKALWNAIRNRSASMGDFENALQFLSNVLFQQTGKKVIILLDEYDAPIHAGETYGYYDDVVLFIRNFMSGGFKDNSSLEKGVITGILRVAKESIFSGLNNPGVYTILDNKFSEYFGFTQDEIEKIISDFKLPESSANTLQQWYNGYRFGPHVIYNPWSVLEFLSREGSPPAPYWVNTSSNDLIRNLIIENKSGVEADIQSLLQGETITTTLSEEIVMRDLENNPKTIWSLLVFSGYLKPVNMRPQRTKILYDLQIPNLEVESFFENSIAAWLKKRVQENHLAPLFKALLNKDWGTFEDILQEIVETVLSYHDTAGDEPERFYHAFLAGLFLQLSHTHQVRSNRESGYGRYDLTLIPKDTAETGFVIEIKKLHHKRDKTAEGAMQSALKQIREKDYAADMRAGGINDIMGIGIVVEKKQIWVETIEIKT